MQWLIIFLFIKILKVGKSLIENNTNKLSKKFIMKLNKNNCKIIIPDDCVVGTSFESEGINKNLDQIQKNEIILDIGSNSIKKN